MLKEAVNKMAKDTLKKILDICNDEKRTDANKVTWIKEEIVQAILRGEIG